MNVAESHGAHRAVTVVLDDDPTGTQEVTGVPVLLRRDPDALERLLRTHDAVFVLTNTRAMPESEAVALIRQLLADIHRAEQVLGVRALVVQRGDSTLRGHVFAEIDAAGRDEVVVFCPSFPAGGRKTVAGVHLVRVEDEWLNSADTEFAEDPVFGYRARSQVEYVNEKGRGRTGIPVPFGQLRDALRSATPGTVLLPDAENDAEILDLASDIEAAVAEGIAVIVRSAAPLAAYLAQAKSTRYLTAHDAARGAGTGEDGGVLVVVGSHTAASTAQLTTLAARGVPVHEVDTAAALADPVAAGRALAAVAEHDLREGIVAISSARHRLAAHATLSHAEAVMHALTTAATELAPQVRSVVAKGGITSAEIARVGLGYRQSWVLGQLFPGISLWTLSRDPKRVSAPGLLYAVVPGNIGTTDTLHKVVRLVQEASISSGME